jgi:hypothetical protein
MRVRVGLTAVALAALFPATVLAEVEGTIPAEVRENGAFERIIVSTDKPVRLADLVGAADLVIEAAPVAERSYLDATATHIYTDYAFAVQAILKNRLDPGLRSGHSVVVRRETGTVLVEGVAASTVENGFAPFAQNARYVLFLKELPNGGGYGVLAGGRGAFEAAADIVPMVPLSDDESDRSLSRDAFLGEVKALLKFTE